MGKLKNLFCCYDFLTTNLGNYSNKVLLITDYYHIIYYFIFSSIFIFHFREVLEQLHCLAYSRKMGPSRHMLCQTIWKIIMNLEMTKMEPVVNVNVKKEVLKVPNGLIPFLNFHIMTKTNLDQRFPISFVKFLFPDKKFVWTDIIFIC